MPITKSAKKALRGSARKRAYNLERKTVLKQTMKKITKLVATKKTDEARKLLPEAQKIIDKAEKTGILKKNTAARKKSRIAAMVKKAAKV